jgi:predicted kinase
MDKENKPVVRIMTGLPGSGKSTVAKELPGLRVCLDDIRLMMGWTSQASWDKGKEAVAIETMMSAIEGAIEEGHDVIADNTHLTARLPGIMRRRVGGRATFQVCSLLDVPIDECIKRDASRERSVGEQVIRKMAKTASKWKLTEEYMNVWPDIEPVGPYLMGKPECIIVDLDGTAAIHNGRGPFETTRCDEDLVDNSVSCIVFSYDLMMDEFRKSLGDELQHKIIFLSGREGTEEVRGKTLKWLLDDFGVADLTEGCWELFMRAEGDSRPDFIVKYELYNKHIRGQLNPIFSLDDRNQVVRLWRELGLKCLQTNWGNF